MDRLTEIAASRGQLRGWLFFSILLPKIRLQLDRIMWGRMMKAGRTREC